MIYSDVATYWKNQPISLGAGGRDGGDGGDVGVYVVEDSLHGQYHVWQADRLDPHQVGKDGSDLVGPQRVTFPLLKSSQDANGRGTITLHIWGVVDDFPTTSVPSLFKYTELNFPNKW